MTRRVLTLFSAFIVFVGISVSILINPVQAQVVVVPLGGLEPAVRAYIGVSGEITGSGIQSVAHNSTGVYELTLQSAVGPSPIVLVSPYTGYSSVPEVMGYELLSTTKILIRIFDGNTGASRNSAFSIMIIRNG